MFYISVLKNSGLKAFKIAANHFISSNCPKSLFDTSTRELLILFDSYF